MQDPHVNNNGILLTVMTMMYYIISRFTIQEWASVATIATALCACAYYINSIIISRKKKKQ